MEHKILTGKKGGKYWLDDNGKKYYIKDSSKSKVRYVLEDDLSNNTIPTKKECPRQKKLTAYQFRAYYEYDEEDGDWLWTPARSEQEARDILMHDHWGITRLDLYKTWEYEE